jgi:hypothetical protein
VTAIIPAPGRLADLAEEMRPDWDRRQFEGALDAAARAGWSWLRQYDLATSLMRDENATPYDMAVAVRDPRHRSSPGDPGEDYRAARAAMKARRCA